MITITLPDSQKKQFNDTALTIEKIAESISPSLAKNALAGEVDGKLVDISYPIQQDAAVKIITEKDLKALEILRHSCAHLLAHAAKQLFPTVQVTIGPVIEDGFYYDFAFERAFTPEDLAAIEKRMHELAKKDFKVRRFEMSRDEAISFFEKQHENYKVEIIKDIPGNETLSFYEQGDFTDLCRGPHIPSTGKIKYFKLTKVAGAYWRGNPKNPMLQRIYGTAWFSQKDLDGYLKFLEEAEKRDHRKIGKQLDLFHLQEEAPGMVFWHAKGWTIYQIIENYIRGKLKKYNYEEVRTPQVVDRSLWERSGHWEKFGKEMFTVQTEERIYAIKPMNCPCHVQIFNQGLRSYRDLPLRMAESGSCHRNEASGALHGLLRVRHMVQDDGHIFCTESQIQSVIHEVIKLIYEVYYDFGFDDIIVKLSTRPDERVGEDTVWDIAETALQEALKAENIEFTIAPGEGAFYGPKIEFSMKDCLNRVWQCGTIQLDFSMPQRLDAKYVAEDSSRKTPVMIHRAILGTFERFIGILIEHYAGHFPVWLAPVQVIVMNITDAQTSYVQEIQKQLQQAGLRVQTDLRNEKIGYKIREHTLQKVPYLIVVGDQEMQNHTLAVRKQNGENLGAMTVAQFIEHIQQQLQKLGRAL